MADQDAYYHACKADLLRTLNDPSLVQAARDLVAPLDVRRVLDVGCGIGQALFPLAVSKQALGVGVDVSASGLRLGHQVYTTHLPTARLEFCRAKAESLPFAPNGFDVVHCGLALPYTDNARSLAEVARVLRPGGVFILKIHHTYYYLRQLWQGLRHRNLSSVLHAGRVLVTGTLYHLTRRQPQSRLLNESFQTRWLLGRELAKHGLFIDREHRQSNPRTPVFVIYKRAAPNV
ncbi:MAG: class I SAM-dependent methyltransferase [Gammaproteobacteria bacterium]